MTAAAVASFDSAPAVGRARFFPRIVEFLMVGGATPFLFPIAWLLRRALGVDTAELPGEAIAPASRLSPVRWVE